MRKTTKLCLAGASVAAMTLGMTGTAVADVQPRLTDVVGVGSDTVQYVANFVNDGDNLGNSGYNTINTSRRVFSFDATADAAGRAVYSNCYSTAQAGCAAVGDSLAMTPTVVLRAGTAPVNRPNGSTGGISALIADSTHKIDFVRASRALKAAEQTNATAASGVGLLHSYQIATDGMQMAVSGLVTSNAPGGSTPTGITCGDIVSIYTGAITTWNQLPGNSGGSTAVIRPVIPQSGSGTRSDFDSVMKSCNGGTLPAYSNANAVVAEEHDQTPIKSDPNAIGPFSTGRKNLIDTGYFGASQPSGGVKLLPGGPTTSSAADNWFVARKFYIIVRESDVNSATPMQIGGSNNWVKTLFGTATSAYASPSRSANFTSAGVTQAWLDFGNATVG